MKIRALFNSLSLIFLALCLSGCTAKETVKLRDENKEAIFQSESLDIDWEDEEGNNSMNTGVDLIAAGKGKAVMHAFAVEKDHSAYEQKLYLKDENTDSIKEIPFLFEEDRCLLLAVGEDGVITMLLTSKKDDASVTYTLTQIDDNGNEKNRTDISRQIEEVAGVDNLLKMVPDKEGNVYFWGGSLKVYRLNVADGRMVESDENIQILNMARNKAGEMIYAVYDKDMNIVIRTGNLMDGKLNDIARLPANEDGVGISELFQSSVYDFCYRDKEAVYGYDGNKKRFYKILDFEQSNINSEKLSQLCEISAYTFIGTSTDTKTADRLSGAMVFSEETEQKDRAVLKMGGINIPPIIQTAVSRYNQANQEFRIDMLDYGSYENPQAKINAEIMAGEGFDLLCFNGLYKKDYADKKLLEDLYVYMDKEQDIAKTDFIDSVLEVLEQDGKLYDITPGFGISTAIGRASLLKDKGSIGFGDMEELLQRKEKQGKMQMFYRETREGMLRHFCKEIDRNFERLSHEDLMNWLETAGQLPKETEQTSLLEAVKNKEFLLMTDICAEFNDILIYERMFGEEAVFTGYPFQEGDGTELNCMGMNVGICKSSAHKEAAWEFIKILLDEEFQYYVCYPNCFPVRKDCMERVIRMVSAVEEYTDRDGNNVKPYCCEMTYDDVDVVIEAMNEEEEKRFWSLVDSMKYEDMWDENIMSIVNEEAEKYFSGQKSLEKAVDSMEERIKLHFNEMN